MSSRSIFGMSNPKTVMFRGKVEKLASLSGRMVMRNEGYINDQPENNNNNNNDYIRNILRLNAGKLDLCV